MTIKNILYIILVIILVLFSCKKETVKNVVPEEILSDEELYKIEQEELENYLLNNDDLINLGIIFPHKFVEKYGEENILYYHYYREWDDEVVGINYKYSRKLLLVKKSENEYYVLLEQYLIPFAEVIVLHTIARIDNDIFVFKTQDGWDNVIVGEFYFYGNIVVLKTDCEKSFNFTGRNFAGRHYSGDIYIIERGVL
ncbi:MAG: hypothetical protein LBI28_01465 [Treponema sp.]|jgi:hypothetical protein|nr:hypothetical protein [Treponema sp.]